MIANISVPRAMQFAVTGRVWVDNVKLRTSFLACTRFNSSWLSYSLTLMTTEIPQCDMIIMFVQSDKYNPKGLLKNRTVWARLKSRLRKSFPLFFLKFHAQTTTLSKQSEFTQLKLLKVLYYACQASSWRCHFVKKHYVYAHKCIPQALVHAYRQNT